MTNHLTRGENVITFCQGGPDHTRRVRKPAITVDVLSGPPDRGLPAGYFFAFGLYSELICEESQEDWLLSLPSALSIAWNLLVSSC
jgi:hypothetical protein